MQIKVIAPKEQKKKKIKVCAYCRVSTDSSEQENSLDNQRDYYESKIRSNPSYEFVDVYYDFGISGFKEMRPGFQKMIDDAKQGKIDLILTKSISRISRNTYLMLKTVRELQSIGVGIFFELQNMNTLSGEGELLLSIYSAFAQAESDTYSQNAYMTYKRKFQEGIPAVRIEQCFGYRLNEKGELVFDELQIFIVRKIFRLAAEGINPNRISTYLNENHFYTGSGKKWSCCAIQRILRNEIYKGDVMMQKTCLDANRKRHQNMGQMDRYYLADNHKAAVSEELWETVQDILDANLKQNRKKKGPRKMGGNSHNTYPLTGMLYCPYCGSMLHHRVSNQGKQTYWVCGKKIKKGANACPGISIPEEVADELIVDEPSIVKIKEDELGRKSYYTILKAEYEAKRSCPYKVKKSNHRYSHSTYPLSGKLYCSKCKTVMHHQIAWNGKEFWWCGRRVKKGADACEGIRVPADIVDSWNITEEVYVTEGVDENGESSYRYQSKYEIDKNSAEHEKETEGGSILPSIHGA